MSQPYDSSRPYPYSSYALPPQSSASTQQPSQLTHGIHPHQHTQPSNPVVSDYLNSTPNVYRYAYPNGATGYPQASQNTNTYPNGATSGYPNPQTSATGYAQTSATGYPQTSATGYPQTSATGYAQTSATGYPQTSATGYAQNSQVQPSVSGYPSQTSNYPSQSGSGAPAYSTSNGSYPPVSGSTYPNASNPVSNYPRTSTPASNYPQSSVSGSNSYPPSSNYPPPASGYDRYPSANNPPPYVPPHGQISANTHGAALSTHYSQPLPPAVYPPYDNRRPAAPYDSHGYPPPPQSYDSYYYDRRSDYRDRDYRRDDYYDRRDDRSRDYSPARVDRYSRDSRVDERRHSKDRKDAPRNDRTNKPSSSSKFTGKLPEKPLTNSEKANLECIMIYNLANDVPREDIAEVFMKYGDVMDVHVPRHRVTKKTQGYAFIRFKTLVECNNALQASGTMIHGKKIQIQPPENCKLNKKHPPVEASSNSNKEASDSISNAEPSSTVEDNNIAPNETYDDNEDNVIIPPLEDLTEPSDNIGATTEQI